MSRFIAFPILSRLERQGNTLHGFCTHFPCNSRFVLLFQAELRERRGREALVMFLIFLEKAGAAEWD
ncbi:hypothetical protein [Rhizobium sp. KDH_Rht_773_N]